MKIYSTSISQLHLLIISSLVCLCAGYGHQEKIYTSSSHPGAQNVVNYTVLYTDSVILRCPEVSNNITRPSWGRIVHRHKVGISQCYDNAFNCSISGGVVNEAGQHLFGHEDSGLYFCRDFGTENEYYLNLTVFVPPLIMGNVVDCKSYHYCEQSYLPLDPNGSHDFNITVEYYGINVTVDWQRNGMQINCTEPICNRMETSDGLNHKTTLNLKMSHAGKHEDFTGTYTANLSNTYGWNISSVAVRCVNGLLPPNSIVSNNTQDLTAGSTNAQLSCSVEYGNYADVYIGMCYAPNGESFRDVNVTENCVFCEVGQDDKYCTQLYDDGTIQSRPDWKVSSRDVTVLDCLTKHTTVLEIPRVSMADDEGIVYCTWLDDLQPMVYEQHSLRVKEPAPTWIQVNWKYIAIGGGLATGGVILVVMLLVIAFVRSWRKAKYVENRLKRRRENKRRSPPLPRPEPAAGSDMSDTDVVFKPNPSQSSQSSTGSQSSGQIAVDADVHVQSPLLPARGKGQHSILHYGTVEQPSHHSQEPGEYTDAPLICTTADEEAYGWTLPGAHKASKSNV